MADRFMISTSDASRRDEIVLLSIDHAGAMRAARRARPSQAWPRRIRNTDPDQPLTAGAATTAHSTKRAAQL